MKIVLPVTNILLVIGAFEGTTASANDCEVKNIVVDFEHGDFSDDQQLDSTYAAKYFGGVGFTLVDQERNFLDYPYLEAVGSDGGIEGFVSKCVGVSHDTDFTGTLETMFVRSFGLGASFDYVPSLLITLPPELFATSVSGSIYDIDGSKRRREQWLVITRDLNDNIISEELSTNGTYNACDEYSFDSKPWDFLTVNENNVLISTVEIKFVGEATPSSVGLAFDNFIINRKCCDEASEGILAVNTPVPTTEGEAPNNMYGLILNREDGENVCPSGILSQGKLAFSFNDVSLSVVNDALKIFGSITGYQSKNSLSNTFTIDVVIPGDFGIFNMESDNIIIGELLKEGLYYGQIKENNSDDPLTIELRGSGDDVFQCKRNYPGTDVPHCFGKVEHRIINAGAYGDKYCKECDYRLNSGGSHSEFSIGQSQICLEKPTGNLAPPVAPFDNCEIRPKGLCDQVNLKINGQSSPKLTYDDAVGYIIVDVTSDEKVQSTIVANNNLHFTSACTIASSNEKASLVITSRINNCDGPIGTKFTLEYIVEKAEERETCQSTFEVSSNICTKKGKCSTYGDPHTLTFDSYPHHYGNGTFASIVRAEDLEIFGKHKHYYENDNVTLLHNTNGQVVSSYDHIYIQYKNTLIKMTSEDAHKFEPQLSFEQLDEDIPFEKIEYKFQDLGYARSHTFSLPDGSIIVMNTHWWGRYDIFYINIFITLSPRYQSTINSGICGDWNLFKWDDTYRSAWAQTKWNRENDIPAGIALPFSAFPEGVAQLSCDGSHSSVIYIENVEDVSANQDHRRTSNEELFPAEKEMNLPECATSWLVEKGARVLGNAAKDELKAVLQGAAFDEATGMDTACSDIQDSVYENVLLDLRGFGDENSEIVSTRHLFDLNPRGCNYPNGDPSKLGCKCGSGFGDVDCSVVVAEGAHCAQLKKSLDCLHENEAIFIELINFNFKDSIAECIFNGDRVVGFVEENSSFLTCAVPSSVIGLTDIILKVISDGKEIGKYEFVNGCK